MRQILIVIGIVLAFPMAISSSAAASARTVSEITVTLGDWEFVPLMNGVRVECLVALRDPELAIGENVTAVWFQRVDDNSWRAFAWAEPGNMKAIAYLKSYYGLSDSSDTFWPDPDAQQGVDLALAMSPDAFARGVFAHDAFAPVINAISDPQLILTGLAGIGYPAAAIPIQTTPTNCAQDHVLSTLAAMVEADLGTNASGTLLVTYAIPLSECDFWRSLAAPLDVDGMWMMPDLTDYMVATTDVDAAGAWQSVASGLVFGGSQTVLVEVGGLDATNEPYIAAKLVLSLVDVTPPDLLSELVNIDPANSPSLVSPSGVPYFVSPAQIGIEASATDSVCLEPTVYLYLNGSLVDASASVSESGFYSVRVVAVDGSGNSTSIDKFFEIRDKPEFSGVCVIEDFFVVSAGASQSEVTITILLTGSDFLGNEINLPSVGLWFTDSNGRWINETPFPIYGAYDSSGHYNPESTHAFYEKGFMKMTFSGFIPDGSPDIAGLDLIGSGKIGETGVFDFRSISQIAIDPDPIQTLQNLNLLNDDSTTVPTFQVTPMCHWRQVLDPGLSMVINNSSGFTPCGWAAEAEAKPMSTKTDGLALDDFTTCSGSHGGAATAHSGAVVKVYVYPAGCCQSCEISIFGTVGFSAYATINPPGRAATAGRLAAVSGAFSMAAAGGIAVGDWSGEFVQWGDISIPVYDQEPPVGELFQDEDSQTLFQCSANIQIHTGAWINVFADARWSNWVAMAHARIENSYMTIQVEPLCLTGQAAPIPPIRFEVGQH